MREHHLLVPPELEAQSEADPDEKQTQPTKPNEWWGIDMTKVLLQNVG